jgi:hypothetical protein
MLVSSEFSKLAKLLGLLKSVLCIETKNLCGTEGKC